MTAIFSHEKELELKESFFSGLPNGFYVDVGANHPFEGSQSWHLEKIGWTGVLIEPQPTFATQLREMRNAKTFQVACSSPENAGSSLPMHVAGERGLHSSLDPDFFVAGSTRLGTISVPAVTLDSVLVEADAPVPLDLIAIDVEGHAMEVLRGLDLERWQPRLIMIEDLVLAGC